MDRCTSYWLYQKYENRGGQGFVPAFDPLFVYSIDGDGTMPIRVKSEMDAACGCIERWVDTLGYICGDCEVGYQFRWVNCNPSTYTYYGDYKYNILCEEISEDGVTWSATTNTKLSTQAVGVADKKIKATFENGDVFGQSCGTDDGVWHSYAEMPDGNLFALTMPQYTSNLYDNSFEDFSLNNIYSSSVSALSFSDCVFEIGTRYRMETGDGGHYTGRHSIYDNDVAESGGIVPPFYCGNGMFGIYSLSAVTGWGIRELSLPNSLKWIGGRVFSCNKIRSLTLPSSVETIGFVRGFDRYTQGAAEWDSLPSGTFAFNEALAIVNLNEGLKSIGSYDFVGCTALEKVEIPSTLEYMGDDVFSACTNMKQIIFKSPTPPSPIPNPPRPHGIYFDLSGMDDVTVYVPCGSKADYESSLPSISGRVEEYGGTCGSIPPINESTYRVVATYKVGDITYYRYDGKVGSTTDFPASTRFFEYCTDTYGYADEIILGEYLCPISGGSGAIYVEINGTRKLTIKTLFEVVGVTTDAEELEIKNSSVYRISFGYYSDHDGIPHIINKTHNLKAITIDSGYTPSFYGCFKSLPELSAVTINGNPSLYYDTFAFCNNLQDVYINYSGGVISAYTSTQHSDYIPFYGCNPNMRVHVPCSLYDSYIADSFWGTLNIVRDTDDC